ncbi:YcnI family protein [Frankia sp. AgB32]|uniref:YcnI family copper-binding membrane protein n=1 Tax=Frankia sp. AgB32 TaxID=631119 RepID=UPI00200CCEA4|nr:YcnI family protein [Frankia sp. AgB32]MCK9894332.1 YcnI family protein [Frankia sp. AgB32]
MARVFLRAGILAAATGVTVVATVLPASAHVTVQPSTAAAGSYATLMFKVPTEEDNASTTGLDVQLPVDNPIASVSVQPKAGWTYKVTKAKPSKPLTTDDGAVDEVVTRITWTADPGSPGIKPGEFDTFTVSAGPLPEQADAITFKTLQNYSNGDVVRWVDVPQAGAAEPEHPAPTVTLSAATAGAVPASTAGSTPATAGAPQAAAKSDSDDGTARTLGTVGIVVGALGLLVGGFGLTRTRRRA